MNADNVRLWVEDLESGRHPQTKDTLCRLDDNGEVVGYCCLGRACEVAIAHGLQLKVRRLGTHYITYNNSSTILPDAVGEWLGVGATYLSRGVLSPGAFYGDLIAMNDNGATFPEIAQYIRERLGM